MTTPKNYRTALVVRPGQPVAIDDIPNVSAIIPAEPQPVVAASNNASQTGLLVVAGLFITLGAALAGFAVWKLSANEVLGYLVGFGLWLGTGAFVYITANGDLPAVLEITKRQTTERRRIKAAQDIAERHYDLAELAEQNRHVEEMAKIDTDDRLAAINDRLAAIYDFMGKLTDERYIPRGQGSYTVTRSHPARNAINEFFSALYTESGELDPQKLHPRGHFKMTVPWRANGGEWRRETWGDQAIGMITEPQNSHRPLVFPVLVNDQPRGWQFNVDDFGDRAKFIAWLSRFK